MRDAGSAAQGWSVGVGVGWLRLRWRQLEGGGSCGARFLGSEYAMMDRSIWLGDRCQGRAGGAQVPRAANQLPNDRCYKASQLHVRIHVDMNRLLYYNNNTTTLIECCCEMCLGGTPFERGQEAIRLAARSVQQRCSIPRGVGVLVRALGGGDRGQGRQPNGLLAPLERSFT